MGSNEHLIYAMQLVTSISLNMVLMNAIKLKLLEAIAEAGPGARLTAHEIVSRLSISNQDAPDMVDRMLRLLASHSIVTCNEGVRQSRPARVYGLTPVARYFIPDEDGASLCASMEFIQDKVFFLSWFGLKDSVVEGGVPFEKVHGKQAFEYLVKDEQLNKAFNKGMVNHTTIVMKEVLECYNGFNNLERLVDVGGGLGITINMIITKYPNINGINCDLPHVIQHAPIYQGIEHVGGDMFKDIPRGDAILLKWVLHDWSDEDCVKLLKNCYKALPIDGKAIIIEVIIPFVPDTSSSTKVSNQEDMMMMVYHGGKKRTEEEFLVLAKHAGFMGIRKKCFACNYWIMEFYK